jgi:hypothetical protein
MELQRAISPLTFSQVRQDYTPEKLAAVREALVASRDPKRNQGNPF